MRYKARSKRLVAVAILTVCTSGCFSGPPSPTDAVRLNVSSDSVADLTLSQLSAKWQADWVALAAEDRAALCGSFFADAEATVEGLTNGVMQWIEANIPAGKRGDVTRTAVKGMYRSQMAANC